MARPIDEFDEDIEYDLQEGNSYALAFMAQDLRDLIGYVAPRSLNAAIKRRKKAEKDG